MPLGQWGDYSLLRKRLKRSKWCRADIKRFMENESLDFLMYVGSIKSPRRFENHEECTDVVCRGRMVNIDSYKQKHVREDCNCHFVHMPSAFADAVNEGFIPLASWNGSEIKLSVYNEEHEMPYVAISHVWSDGKGNNDANALYKCQLDLIDEKIRVLYSYPIRSPSLGNPLFGPTKIRGFQDPWRKPVGFWMDTLCTPVREDQKILRKKSIAQMRDIYESADRVLVFDSLIQELRATDSMYEKCVRLVISNWQHRLWTLQEGVLSRQTCFVLQNGAIILDELKDEEGRKQQGESPGFYDRITSGVQIVPVMNLSLFLDVQEESPEKKRASNFTVLIPTINNRATTRQEDETVCIATLLRIDTNPLQAISSPFTSKQLKDLPLIQRQAEEQQVCDERMKYLLCQIQIFEANVIFNTLERIPSDGFRWAPRSFLGQSGSLVTSLPGPQSLAHSQGHILKSGDMVEGFVVDYTGVILKTPKFAQEPNTIYMEHGKKLFRAVLSLPSDANPLGDGKYVVVMGTIPKPKYNGGVPSILGMLRGTTESGIRKIEHICLATTKVWDPTSAHRISKDENVGLDSKWCIS
ncbi:hypothetical protein VE00_11190 [Pseudogymnoascus sp. WSF 3629]|nr:hypothetical protein VE00_11190 [Pseudogymnoascus sp. WSF 3629]